jgi:hypothetical protein
MANVVPSSPILVTLMMEALFSSETSVLTRAMRRIIPVDGIHHLNMFSVSAQLVSMAICSWSDFIDLEECRLLGSDGVWLL